MGYVIVSFIALDIGILLGWCLRVALVRAQAEVIDPRTAKP